MKRYLVLLCLLLFACSSGDGVVCTADAKECPDGSYVGRDPANNCAFAPCPEVEEIFCAQDVSECADGSFVGRDPANDCQFKECPAFTPNIIISDKDVSDGIITVDQVAMPEDGFIALYNNKGEDPGLLMGYALLSTGLHENIEIEINEKRATKIIFAVLHTDTGTIGTFDVDNEKRVLTKNGEVVLGFTVDIPEVVHEYEIIVEETRFVPDELSTPYGENVGLTFVFNDSEIITKSLEIRSDVFTINYEEGGEPIRVEYFADRDVGFDLYQTGRNLKKAAGIITVIEE